MAVYIAIALARIRIGRKTQVTFTDRQHAFLLDEASRTGLSMSELVRRAVDATYRPHSRQRVAGIGISVDVWRGTDEAVVGRRVKRRLAKPG